MGGHLTEQGHDDDDADEESDTDEPSEEDRRICECARGKRATTLLVRKIVGERLD
jgi:hypothetical protein